MNFRDAIKCVSIFFAPSHITQLLRCTGGFDSAQPPYDSAHPSSFITSTLHPPLSILNPPLPIVKNLEIQLDYLLNKEMFLYFANAIWRLQKGA